MPSCEDFIQKLFEEDPNLTDKEAIAKMKELKGDDGKRLYKTATIEIRLRQFRSKQRVPSEQSGAEKADLDEFDGVKKEVEDAFGKRDETGKEPKKVEPQEMTSGHKVYDGRIDSIESKVDKMKQGDKKELFPVLKDMADYMGQLDKKISMMNEEILQLKQGGFSADEFVDVQLRKSTISMLDTWKTDDSQDVDETVKCLVEQVGEVGKGIPDFLEKIHLDKNRSVHGKLFMQNSKWNFVKRAKPILYGVAGAGVGCLSLFALLILLKALGLLPGWL